MSTYEAVKAELGDGPPYPRKPDFVCVFGYAGGAAIGKFANKAEAVAAGAAATEAQFDEAGYRVMMDAYRAHQSRLDQAFRMRLRADYPEVSDAVFALAYYKAWDDGHSSGHGQVESHLSDIVEFAKNIIAASDPDRSPQGQDGEAGLIEDESR